MEHLASWAVKRLREPSTYAGLAALLGGFGITHPDSYANSISLIAMGIAGVVAMIMAEKGIKD